MNKTNIYERLFFEALRIRMVEEKIIEIFPSDKIKSPVHLSIGQEHHVVAICNALTKEDLLFATFRSHAPYLAKGGDLAAMFAEMYGKYDGIAKGKAGSMHLCAPEVGMMGASAIVAGNLSNALGAAYAAKLKKTKNVVISLSGDGSTEEGVFYECLNFAALKNIPIIFLIENNNLAVHTPIHVRQAYNLKKLSGAFNMDYYKINDGFDMLLAYNMMKKLRSSMIKNNKPCIIEVVTYRYKMHVGIDEDYDKGYRTREEYMTWYNRDPLVKNRILINKYKEQIRKEIAKAVKYAENSPFPPRKELLKDVY